MKIGDKPPPTFGVATSRILRRSGFTPRCYMSYFFIMSDPDRGHAALRRGRFSQQGASYFITVCTRDKQTGLACAEIFRNLCSIFDQLEAEHIATMRILTLMPDHLHMVFRLGPSADMSEVMRLFKGRSSVTLRASGIAWQRGGFYDHKIRPDEPVLPVFHYIFMNPYRKQLLPPGEPWPFFVCSPDDWAWFQHETNKGVPHPEWLIDEAHLDKRSGDKPPPTT